MRSIDVPEEDPARLTGELGCALLEQYGQDGDIATLAAAIEQLSAAVDSGPHHPDCPRWLRHLGQAYGERAVTSGDLDDFNRAVALLYRAHEGLADLDDRSLNAVDIADLSWDRFVTVWCLPGGDETVCARARQLGANLTELSASDDLVADAGRYVALMGGLGLLVAFDSGGDVRDLRQGILAVEKGLDTLDPDGPRWSFIGAQLAGAYRSRAELDGSIDDLDRAIGTATAVIADTEPDRREWWLANLYLALAHQARWASAQQVADLDAAIAAWQSVMSQADGVVHAALCCAPLLRVRAGLVGNISAAADAAEAVRLLTAVLADPAMPDDTTACFGWYELARAHRLRWELHQASAPDTSTTLRESLDLAAHAAQQALRPELLDVDDLLQVRLEQVTIGHGLLLRDADHPVRGLSVRLQQRQRLATAEELLLAAPAADPTVRATVAGHLAANMLGLASFDGVLPADRIRALYDLATTHPDPPPGWPALLGLINGMLVASMDLERLAEPSAAVDDLANVAQFARTMKWRPGSPGRATIDGMLAIAAFAHAMATGDMRGTDAAGGMLLADTVAASSRSTVPATDAAPYSGDGLSESGRAAAHLLVALSNAQAGHPADLGPALDDFVRAADRSPTDRAVVHAVRQFRDMLGATSWIDAAARSEAPAAALADPTVEAGDPLSLAARVATLSVRMHDAVSRDDRGLLSGTADILDELIQQIPPDHVLRLMTSALAAGAYLELARREPVDRSAAHQAARWFAEAARLAGDERNPSWARIMLGQAESLRRAATTDLARSRQLGHAALRGDAWQVIRQTGTDYAMIAANAAADHALTVAGWCIEDRALDELVAALDAGRGLVLAAAVSAHSIASQLGKHGHPEFAAQWQDTAGLGRDRMTGALLGADRTGDELSDDLRLRALTALRSDPDGRSLLSLLQPVEVDDVRADLNRLGLDALVYLLPSMPGGYGMAVVVPVAGPVQSVPLPHLVLDADAPIGRNLETATTTRDLPGASHSAHGGTSLDALCAWAWTAAVGPLIDHTQRWCLRRPARLALVAMTVLGQVPWHAAYTQRGTGRRYAVEDLAISYCVSARLLRRPAHPANRFIRSALIVGNPGGDLAFAGAEARSIQHRFYPDGTYLGQPAEAADGVGTPAQVLDWITRVASGPSLLHFACHGRADPEHPADTYLELAGGHRLAVRDLLEASRAAELNIDTVFLAACTTGRSGVAHDEALSLATAFLAAGARTVFGTLWPVPDAATSLLMYMLHHYLNTTKESPAEALRMAQLWMLDPARQPPDSMPGDLIDRCSRPEAAHPASWAAFTHYGM